MNAQPFDTVVLKFEAVWSPALIAGFVLPVAKGLGQTVRLKFNQTELVIMHGLVLSNGDLRSLSIEQAEHVLVTFKRPDESEHAPIHTTGCSARITRCAIDGLVYSQLQTYAHKTYVPSSDATRAEGAGAGLTDND